MALLANIIPGRRVFPGFSPLTPAPFIGCAAETREWARRVTSTITPRSRACWRDKGRTHKPYRAAPGRPALDEVNTKQTEESPSLISGQDALAANDLATVSCPLSSSASSSPSAQLSLGLCAPSTLHMERPYIGAVASTKRL